jgi:hypothetical protein
VVAAEVVVKQRAHGSIRIQSMFRRQRPHEATKSDSPPNPYEGLRSLALNAVQNGLPPPSDDHPDVSGVVIDIPAQGGFVTVVGMTDNGTSMYTSVGGGTIGAGEREPVASATQALLSAVQSHFLSFASGGDPRLPPSGFVRFHVLSPSGPRHGDVPEDSYWGRTPHELMPVIAASQALVSAIRTSTS